VGVSDVSNTVDIVAPIAQAALTVTGTGASSVNLSWTSVGNDHYEIERSTDGVNFAPVASLPAPLTSYTDTGLAPGLYAYRIHAFTVSPAAESFSNVQGTWVGPTIDQSGGFTNTFDVTVNGSAFIGANLIRLIDVLDDPNQAGSAFSNTRFTVGS